MGEGDHWLPSIARAPAPHPPETLRYIYRRLVGMISSDYTRIQVMFGRGEPKTNIYNHAIIFIEILQKQGQM